MTRLEKHRAIMALRDQHYTVNQVAYLLGMTRSGVRNILNDPDGSKQKARRARYEGVCESCGGRTDGSGGYATVRRICNTCQSEQRHENRYWTQQRIIEAIRRFAKINGRPPLSSEWLKRPGDGYPCVSVVQREFGSWADAIEQAGFERPRRGGYTRTEQHKQRLSAIRRRVDHDLVLQLARDGLSYREIAQRAGCSESAVSVIATRYGYYRHPRNAVAA